MEIAIIAGIKRWGNNMQIHTICGQPHITANPNRHGKKWYCYVCNCEFNYLEKVGESDGTRDKV